jgi:hypothetical protein
VLLSGADFRGKRISDSYTSVTGVSGFVDDCLNVGVN